LAIVNTVCRLTVAIDVAYDQQMRLNTARAITLSSMFGTMATIWVLVVALMSLGIDHRDPVRWLAEAPLEDALAALTALCAAVLCVWLMLTAFGYAAVAVYGLRRVARPMSLLTLPILRRAIDTIAAVSLVSATLGPWAAAAAAARVAATSDVSAAIDRRIAHLVPPGVLGVGYAPAPDSQSEHADDAPQTETPDDTATVNGTSRIHVVEKGDNLWLIACREVRRALPEATLDIVTDYWLEVIEANRDLLRSGDPDLIYPGEHITLVPLPGEPDGP
jgi:hypothetical protein